MIVRDVLSVAQTDNKTENVGNELTFQDPVTSTKKLSELGGGDSGIFGTFTCNEAIVKSQFLNLLSTGRIESIGNKVKPEAIPYATSSDFYYRAPSSGALSVSFDPFRQNRVAVTYAGIVVSQYTYISIVLGTIMDDGTVIFGVENIVSAEVYDADAIGVFDPLVKDRYFLVYSKLQTSYGYTRACSISGDIVTAGPVTQYAATFANGISLMADPFVKGRYAIAFRNSSAYGGVCGVTCGDSGIVATPAAISYFTAASIAYPKAQIDNITAGRIIISYSRNNITYAIIGTFTGTSGTVTYGAENTVTNAVQAIGVCHFATNTAIFSYSIGASLYYKLGTINGNTITFGTEYLIATGPASITGISVQLSKTMTDKVVVNYITSSGSFTVIGTISGGTNISFGSPVLFTTGTRLDVSQDPFFVGRFASVYLSTTGVIRISQIGCTTTNLREDYMIGVAVKSGNTNESIRAQISGLCSGFSGLSPGSIYYIQADGSLSTTVSIVKAGIAVSATSLLLTT